VRNAHAPVPLRIQIRLEYCHVPYATYLKARANVLRGFGNADRLYFTARGAEMEPRARINLSEEIRRLETGGRAA